MPPPHIKAPFESSTFINLKQSTDLKAWRSKLSERIIKQPVSSWVPFSAICTRPFTVSGGWAHLPPVTPCPLFCAASLSLGFHAFRAHKGEAVTGKSPWGHGSLPPSGSRRESSRMPHECRACKKIALELHRPPGSSEALGPGGHSWV